MSERDVCAEMAAEIDAATSDGPYVPRMVADELVEKLRATDPDLLTGWLDAQAEHFVWQAINDRDRSRRGRLRQQAGRARFDAAVKAHEGGDSAATRSTATTSTSCSRSPRTTTSPRSSGR